MKAETSHNDSGAVFFVCPDGHELGPSAVFDAYAGPRLAGMADTAEWRDTPTGGKLAMRCASCERAGRRRDLQASWPRVLDVLRANAADTSAGPVPYTLGG